MVYYEYLSPVIKFSSVGYLVDALLGSSFVLLSLRDPTWANVLNRFDFYRLLLLRILANKILLKVV